MISYFNVNKTRVLFKRLNLQKKGGSLGAGGGNHFFVLYSKVKKIKTPTIDTFLNMFRNISTVMIISFYLIT